MDSSALCVCVCWFIVLKSLTNSDKEHWWFAAHSAVFLKAESLADKTEWLKKLRNVISSKGGQVKGESTPTIRQSHSDGSLVSNNMHFQILEMCLLCSLIFSSFILYHSFRFELIVLIALTPCLYNCYFQMLFLNEVLLFFNLLFFNYHPSTFLVF